MASARWLRGLATVLALGGMLALTLGVQLGCTKKGGPGTGENVPPPMKQKMLEGTMKKGVDTSTTPVGPSAKTEKSDAGEKSDEGEKSEE